MFSIKLPNLENSFEIQESVLKEIISSCDKNGDEQIDFKEFLNSIAQLWMRPYFWSKELSIESLVNF